MTDMENLRPEVREAMTRLERYLHITIGGKHFRDNTYDTILAELLRLAGENATLGELLDSARMDRIDEFRHANKVEAELAALKARIEDGWLCGVSNDKCSGNFDAAIYRLPSRFRGMRVRLLVED